MSNITALPGVVAIGTMLISCSGQNPAKKLYKSPLAGIGTFRQDGAKRVERVAKQLAALAALETGVKGYG